MKKLLLAVAILITGAAAGFAQTNSATKPTQEKAKHAKKESTVTPTGKTTASAPTAEVKKTVAANKSGKHHKKMKKEKAASGK
ncbi:MAG: hypothetical protein KF862_07680 [Chitinophagaceae bacterium]|nr:hypothetical protein [Chitinophagaceae bacterium]